MDSLFLSLVNSPRPSSSPRPPACGNCGNRALVAGVAQEYCIDIKVPFAVKGVKVGLAELPLGFNDNCPCLLRAHTCCHRPGGHPILVDINSRWCIGAPPAIATK